MDSNRMNYLKEQLASIPLEDRLETVQLTGTDDEEGCCSNNVCNNEGCDIPPTN